MKNAMICGILLVYIFFSAFLEGDKGDRIVTADLYLLGVIGVATLAIVAKNMLYLPSIYAAFIPFMILALISAFFANTVDRAAFELLVIAFSFFGSLAMLNLAASMPSVWIQRLVKGYAIVIGALSLVCILDFLLFPGLISSRNLGGLQGPFRNTGQAGSFFGVHSALVIAMLLSKLLPSRPQYLIAAALVVLALLFTFKRASILAVVSGLAFLVLFLIASPSVRDKKVGLAFLVGSVFVGGIGFVLFNWALDAVPGMRWRFETKFDSDTIQSGATGFFAQNIKAAFAAFGDRPLLGVGLGNVQGVYQSHEIHSTYLGIIAYGGMAGILSYLFFMANFVGLVFREGRQKIKTVWSSFLYYLLPLLFGQMIGWGYTPHFRKREFWIMVFFVTLAVIKSRKPNYILPSRPPAVVERRVAAI